MNQKFNWGKFEHNEWVKNTFHQENFIDDVYQKFFQVEENDIVFDVGASVGPFTWSILGKKPQTVVCLEPDKDLFDTLIENLKNFKGPVEVPIYAINKGISLIDGQWFLSGLYNENSIEIADESNAVLTDTARFDTLIKDLNIEKIDFLKTDSEGAEYDIFTQENLPWIKDNVKKIAGEWHLFTPTQKEQFRKFRDTYLKEFNNYEIYSLDYVDIKHSLWSEWFLDYYQAIMIYINNTKVSKEETKTPISETLIINTAPIQNKNKWDVTKFPTMEITTTIPSNGCTVDCVFCPQKVLQEEYIGDRILSLDNFKKLIDKIPTEIRITFAGFTEPWLNRYCSDMVLYAHEKGHPVSVFTTGIGMTVDDCEKIAHIPFAGNPNGGFTLHLPDQQRLAKHPITPTYIKTLTWLSQNCASIQNFSTMCMGEVHESIRHLFVWAPTFSMWSRSGNLLRESILKPELINLKDSWRAVYHGTNPKTCGCHEHVYHNVLLPNGDVSLCCMDYGLEHILGNLYNESYEEVIPEAQSCYELCSYCENGVDPASEKPIKWYSKNSKK